MHQVWQVQKQLQNQGVYLSEAEIYLGLQQNSQSSQLKPAQRPIIQKRESNYSNETVVKGQEGKWTQPLKKPAVLAGS